MAFDAREALNRWGSKEATTIVWRSGWNSERFPMENLRDAILVSQTPHDDAIEVEVHVHLDGADYAIKGEDLKAIAALVEPPIPD